MKGRVEFANLVGRAGEQELLDIFQGLLLPAFTSSRKRQRGSSSFFLEHCQGYTITGGGRTESVFAGRLVKKGVLKREQIHQEGKGVITSPEKMETAPSGLFLLFLNTHKLAYLHETAFAPTLDQLGATMGWLVKAEQHAQLRREKERDKSLTYKALLERHPLPSLNLIPFSMPGEISSFIDQFDVLRSISTRMVRPNNEVNLNPLFADLDTESKNLKSTNTTLTLRNKEGLSRKEAKRFVEAMTKHGNANVSLRGQDEDGHELKGTNDKDFKLFGMIESLGTTIKSRINKVFELFTKIVHEEEKIPVTHTDEADAKAAEIAKENGWKSP